MRCGPYPWSGSAELMRGQLTGVHAAPKQKLAVTPLVVSRSRPSGVLYPGRSALKGASQFVSTRALRRIGLQTGVSQSAQL